MRSALSMGSRRCWSARSSGGCGPTCRWSPTWRAASIPARSARSLDVFGLPLSQWLRRGFLRMTGSPRFAWDHVKKVQDVMGGHTPWMSIYGLMSLSKLRFFSQATLDALSDHIPYADLAPNLGR